jgi:hypothetical protein
MLVGRSVALATKLAVTLLIVFPARLERIATAQFTPSEHTSFVTYELPEVGFKQGQWVGNDNFLLVTSDHNATKYFLSQHMGFERLRPLLALGEAIKKSRSDGLVMPDDLLVSPDGRQVAWRGSPGYFYVGGIDGTHVHSIAISSGNFEAAWQPDSMHVVWFEQDSRLEPFNCVDEFDVIADKLTMMRFLPLSGIGQVATDRGDVGMFGLRMTPSGRAVYSESRTAIDEIDGEMLISEIDINKPCLPAVDHHIKLPTKGARYPFTVISPSGTRVAWALKTGSREEIWVSDMQATWMHSIGYAESKDGLIEIRELDWRPDSGAISFAYRNRLYIVDMK